MNTRSRYLTARQAAERLGVSTATLYAYVSRGMIRSEVVGGDSRTHRYHAEDVEILIARKAQHREPEKVAERATHTALDWGMPVMDSALTLITEDRLYYRGRDALKLAQTETFERVAALLWTGSMDDAEKLFSQPFQWHKHRKKRDRIRLSALKIALAESADRSEPEDEREPLTMARTGAQIIDLLVRTAAIPMRKDDLRLTHAALILCADHELNASSFAARVIASTGANLYEVVAAGLAALSGYKHGGMTERARKMLRSAEKTDPIQVLNQRMQSGAYLPGFGHRLYPDGDPRARVLLALIEAAHGHTPEYRAAKRLIDAALEHDLRPNIDLTLALLCRVLHLPDGAGLGLFALGRTAGWIAHAIEQYSTGTLIRPRARYVGVLPEQNGLR